MVIYSLIMLATAALLMGVGIAICRGKTNLIHDYHQTKVKDKAGYARAFGRAMLVFSLGPLLSGIIGFFTDSAAGLAVLFLGFGAGLVCIVRVQRKYNQGVF